MLEELGANYDAHGKNWVNRTAYAFFTNTRGVRIPSSY